MSGDTTTITLVILAGLGLLALAAGVGVFVAWRRRRRQQARLDIAFERARRVGHTGSGIQGKPYSVYSEPSWNDEPRPRH